ncbi:MAG TPA: serine hydrolase domain-containing protein [Vicinamibacterales bacterium]|nr:serine hydrolase domain-containing protein [Vicinamibacterales bacterium]
MRHGLNPRPRRVRARDGAACALVVGIILTTPGTARSRLFADAPPTDNPRVSAVDKAVHAAATEFFSDPVHIGLSIVVVDRGKTAFYDYGTISKATPRLPTPDSVYEIGSITKTFTGVLAAQAVLNGTMALDADFRQYLDEPYPNLEAAGRPITLRTLMTHTAGMPRDLPATDRLFVNPDFETLPYQLITLESPYDRVRYLRELHDVTLASVPGQKVSYSNIGIKLIGFGLEKIAGRPLSEIVSARITGPRQMASTTLDVPPRDRRRLAVGYSPAGKPSPYHVPNAGAAGGLYSSARDMARYLAWHLDERDEVIRQSHAVIAGDLRSFAEGMGWNIAATADGQRRIWQSGGVFGMSSQMILFPDRQLGFVLLANDAGFNTQSQLEAIVMHCCVGDTAQAR